MERANGGTVTTYPCTSLHITECKAALQAMQPPSLLEEALA